MIRIGTRGSRLALRQAALVQEALKQADSQMETELVVLHTKGDQMPDRPLAEIGDKGIFASEFEPALLKGEIDLAVHSAKDLPVKLMDGLVISAVLPRADVRDVLVVPAGGGIPGSTPQLFRIGTGSRRRQMLAGQAWENVICTDIRGNVDTRLRKLQTGGYDGIILAKAGLDRLGIDSEQESAFDFYPLVPEQFLPAACQGMIAVEAAEGSAAARICEKITDKETELAFAVEREVLTQLSADCSEAIAAWCRRVRAADEQVAAVIEAVDEQCQEAMCAEDKLLLDVMYAGNRVRLTCQANVEGGIRLARQAAQMVKETS